MLDINLEFIRGMLFIRLEGILDINTIPKLNECFNKMIHKNGIKFFILNLESLEKVDDEGLKTIIDKYFDITLHDGKLIICGYNKKYNINLELENIFNQIEHTKNELTAVKLINI